MIFQIGTDMEAFLILGFFFFFICLSLFIFIKVKGQAGSLFLLMIMLFSIYFTYLSFSTHVILAPYTQLFFIFFQVIIFIMKVTKKFK